MQKTPSEAEVPDEAQGNRSVAKAELPPAEGERPAVEAAPAVRGGSPRAQPEAAVRRGGEEPDGSPEEVAVRRGG